MGKLPAILLYDGDWVKDGVAGCSLGAQGLWLRMCFIGHNSERYGYLQVNGRPIPQESIARRCGCTLAEYETYLSELDRNGVPSRTPDEIIFSRRLVSDAKERAIATARKRKSRSSHESVTPLSVNEDVTVNEVEFVPLIKPKFTLEEFDSEARFLALCEVYPKPNNSVLGMQAYERAIESQVSLANPDRNKIADKIEKAARLYAGAKLATAKKFIPEMIAWLDKGIWKQNPSCWEELGNGEGQRKQTAGDRYSAALRGANAPHGEQLEKP